MKYVYFTRFLVLWAQQRRFLDLLKKLLEGFFCISVMFDGFESFEHEEKSTVTLYFWDGYVAGSSTQKFDVPLIYREDFKFGAPI